MATLGKKQQLVTLHGGDVPIHLDDMWQRVQKGCKQYCDTWNCYYSSVKSNFNQLYRKDKPINKSGLWTMATQSLSYSGMVAPLTIAKGYPFILIGSAVTADLPIAYGSHPFIDHKIRYAGVNVLHFGGECTRADKIRHIIETTRKHQKPNPQLRVCWKKEPRGKNCCECINKCLPTIHGLLAEGVDPRAFGFEDWQPERMVKQMQAFFAEEQIMNIDRASIWNSIKNRIQEQLAAGLYFGAPLENYFAWFIEQDFMHRINPDTVMDPEVKVKLKAAFERSMQNAYKRFEGYFQAVA
jgi:hypothetical protein